MDIIRKNQINFAHLRYFVLDEADKMLDLNFTDELNTVLQSVRCGEWVRIVYYNKRKYTELIGAVDMISEQLQILSVQGTVIPFRYIKELNLYDI